MKRLFRYFALSKWGMLVIYSLFFLSITALSQIKITGVVTGKDNLALNGATVAIKNSNIFVLTDNDGNYTIDAKNDNALIISFIGYASQQIEIGNKAVINISLQELIVNLDEILLTGYTKQNIKEITGSVAVVKAKELTAVPAGQVEQMLQGRVAGLTVITSGMPGGKSIVRLHGIGNFGDAAPLYIIDGVQGNPDNLNPRDIETLVVLKDAGASAIYGVRGGNGVIVITTKKGKPGKSKVSFDFYVGVQQPLSKGPDLLNPQEMGELTWLALKNSGQVDVNGNPYDPYYGNGPTPVVPDYIHAGWYNGLFNGDPRVNPDLYNIDFTNGNVYQIVPANKNGTDWFNEVFKPALNQNYTVTVSGGNEKNKYLFSLGYLDQQGTLLNTYLKRLTGRINTTFAVSDHIRIGENLQLSYRDNPQVATQQGPNNNEVYRTITASPMLPVYDIKGGWASFASQDIRGNPVASRVIPKDDKTSYTEIFGNAWAEVDFLKNFTFATQFGGAATYYYLYNFNFLGYTPVNNLPNNSFNESSGYRRSWTWTNTLNFSTTFLNDQTIKVLLGTEAISNYNRETGGSRRGYFTDDPNYRFLTNGSPASQTNYSFASTSSLYSFFSRVDYGYKEKYFLSATLRNDGSSVFVPENRYGWFPSVSVAWRITEEKLLNQSNWLSDLKLRGSWGKTGFYGNTDPFNQYTLYGGNAGNAYYDINGTGNSVVQGFRATRIGEPTAGWQQDIVFNAGFESVLWNGRLNITADWFHKQSSGLLFPLLLPDVLGGATPPNANVGDIKNTGIDILLASKGRFSKDFSWDAAITFTTYKSLIVKLNDIPYFDAAYNQGGVFVRNAVGQAVSSFYGYKIIGFFKNEEDVSKSAIQDAAKTGRFKYKDADANGVINEDDRVFYGNPNPDFTVGINIGINYKSFDFSAFFYTSVGNDVLNISRALTDFYATYEPNTAKSKTALYNSWTPQNPNAKAPIVEDNPNFSNIGTQNSYLLEDGSYFRSKSMILGYTLPKNLLQKIKVERLRFYIQAVNLFTITNYTGLDPELSGYSAAFGIDFGNYPNNQRQFLIGASVNF